MLFTSVVVASVLHAAVWEKPPLAMADVPDTLVLRRHRDLEGMYRSGLWLRRIIIFLISIVSLLGLLNVFGQRPATARSEVDAAIVSLYAPTRIRGGDFMEARFHITAKRDLKKAMLELDPGWAEGMSLNTVEPSPIGEASDDGRLVFTLGHIPAGKAFILFMQFQVNPTNLAWHRPQNVTVLDGNQVLTTIHRTITVFP
jgi:hypothetical protein